MKEELHELKGFGKHKFETNVTLKGYSLFTYLEVRSQLVAQTLLLVFLCVNILNLSRGNNPTIIGNSF